MQNRNHINTQKTASSEALEKYFNEVSSFIKKSGIVKHWKEYFHNHHEDLINAMQLIVKSKGNDKDVAIDRVKEIRKNILRSLKEKNRWSHKDKTLDKVIETFEAYLNTIQETKTEVNLSEGNQMKIDQRFSKKEEKLVTEKFNSLVTACKLDINKLSGESQLDTAKFLIASNIAIRNLLLKLYEENNLLEYKTFNELIELIDDYKFGLEKRVIEIGKNSRTSIELNSISTALILLKETLNQNTKLNDKQIDEMLNLEIDVNRGKEMALAYNLSNGNANSIIISNLECSMDKDSEFEAGLRMAQSVNDHLR